MINERHLLIYCVVVNFRLKLDSSFVKCRWHISDRKEFCDEILIMAHVNVFAQRTRVERN